MNDLYPDDEVRRAHELFRRNHAEARQALLQQLDQPEPPPALRRGGTWSRGAARLLAAAAALLVAVTLGSQLWLSPQRAYALADMPQRLQELRSIYLSGWIFAPDGEKHPMTFFAERPGSYWHTAYGFSGGGDGRPTKVTSRYSARHGQELLVVSHDEKSATVLEVSPLVAELDNELMFELSVFNAGLQGRLNEYAKVRTEKLGDLVCDVYEHSSPPGLSRVWLNPQTGLPVQIAAYLRESSGKETPLLLYDHIETNVTAAAKGLSFAPPEGYQVKRAAIPADANPLLMPTSSGGAGSDQLATWYALRITDQVALLCWSHQVGGAKKESEVRITLANGEPCEHVEVASADVQGQPWRWSLVMPKKADQKLGNEELQLTLVGSGPKGGQVGLGAFPIRFPDERLRTLILEVQKATGSKTPSGEPFTLEGLREKVGNRK